MENHPIPQDVTGFQFKLIGDMTIKQFAFLAVGVVLGWMFFSLPFPWYIKFPFGLGFFTLGPSLAFLPLGGRPMDTMLLYFFKALFRPNQFVYNKTGGQLIPMFSHRKQTSKKHHQDHQASYQPKNKLQTYLSSMAKTNQAKTNKLDMKEMTFFQSLGNLSFGSPSSAHLVTPDPVQKPAPKPLREAEKPKDNAEEMTELSKEAQVLAQAINSAKLQEAGEKNPQTAAMAHQKVLELEKQLQEVQAQKTRLEQELQELQKKLQAQKSSYTPGVIQPTQPKQVSQTVRKVPKGMGKSVGLPIAPDVPNLITGIIKDSRGNILPNILVEMKDKEGNPVRAFKTNGLGQFASATPLSNGVYTIEFEDPQKTHSFDVVEIPITGELVSPLEVISRDQREELRRALFQN